MSRAEEVFLPVFLFLKAVSFVWFFQHMAPALAAAVLLGWFPGEAVLFRLAGVRRRQALAALWDLAALGLSVFLGCLNGWWLLFDARAKLWGGCLALGAYLLARVLSARIRKKKERG